MPSAMDNKYDIIRKRIDAQANADAGAQKQQMTRSFARTGMLGSGAQVKSEQLLQDKLNAQKQQAREGVDIQELGEKQRLEEIANQQAFQAGEAAKQRAWGTSERAAGQAFSAGEAAKQRGFQKSERIAGQDFSKALYDNEMKFKQAVQAFAESSFAQQMEMAMKQFEMDERVTNFNMDMAQKMLDKKSLMDRLAGGIATYGGSQKYMNYFDPGGTLGSQGLGWF